LQPDLTQDLKIYLQAGDGPSTRFAAVFVMLRNPGLRPTVESGFPRGERDKEIDNYRDNWWNLAPTAPPPGPTVSEPAAVAPISYLSAAEVTEGRAEFAQLVKTAAIAPNYLSAVAIEWANKHPEDARVPEALALAVRSTRYGATDKETTNWSKSAFVILHGKYPNSPWTQRTKYWY
jgi:hypothetical protein